MLTWLLIVVLIVALLRVRAEVMRLRTRVESLERNASEGAHLAAPATAAAGTTVETKPVDFDAPLPSLEPQTVPRPQPASPPSGPVLAPRATAPSRPGRALDGSALEQLIGGIWLQNVGSVLLLLGVFLMIVWGYRTGRIGPGVLVASGILLGLAFVWRGDRIARSVAAFGHALIGVGLGIVYISLYLGHFQLDVLTVFPAFISLTTVALATVGVGLRYRVPIIAALGVIGAFVPQWVPLWTSMSGFDLPPATLLAYFALVDAVVFVLAASAGWSGLALMATVLTAGTWVLRFTQPQWGWTIEIGLAALFVLLGLAPLPALVRRERIRTPDLAVVAFAPLGFLAASAPMLMAANPHAVAVLVIALAAVHLGAALWVSAHRTPPDLWRVLTGAAVLYLTIGLERALGTEHTPLAWTIEGVVLVAIGARAGGGWMRLCGSVVAVLGTLWLVGVLAMGWSDARASLDADAVRTLVAIAALLLVAFVLARRRANLTSGEQFAPEAWGAAGNLLLMVWTAREAAAVASALQGSHGRWGPPPVGVPVRVRQDALAAALRDYAWVTQATALVVLGARGSRTFLRACGTIVAAVALLALLVAHVGPDGWWLDQWPIVHPPGTLELLGIALAIVAAVRLAAARSRLNAVERYLPEVWALGVVVAVMIWSVRESGHIARTLIEPSGFPGILPAASARDRISMLRASITSGAWLIEAVALLVAGWLRSSAFLRWCGLVLFGVTLLKFVMLDLQRVDVFWRFLTAMVVGAAMLAISYAYQARARGRAARSEPPVP